ncbi:MAG: CvpA family protein [Tannerella sp.]|jgi:membrane protein required for colicin V production|nr:CvpA family protein [Tannerella sp.]
MNWLDITIVCLAVIGFVKGYSDGFIRQMVMLTALVVAIYLCGAVAVYLRSFILETGMLPERGVTVVSHVLAFLLIVCITVFAGNILHKAMDVTPLSFPNHLAGGVFALGFTLLLVSLTLNVIDGSALRPVLIPQDIRNESRLYHPVIKIVPAVYIGSLFEGEDF